MTRTPLWLRLAGGLLFEVASAAVVVGVPGAWLLRHLDLGHLAAERASAALGRTVTVGALHVVFARTLKITLDDVAVANVQGGSAPDMATLRHLAATVDAQSLLHGPVVLHNAHVDGLALLLEHTADRTKNWQFGPPKPPPADPTGRTGFPSLRDVTMAGSEIVYRTGSGKRLVTKLDDVAIETRGDDQPVHLAIAGGYNGVPLTLDADLQSIAALRQPSVPFGTVLHLASGAMRLVFDGTMTDPLNFDGLKGTLQLDAPDPKPLFAFAGVDSALDAALHLAGSFEHRGPLWRLQDGRGQLAQDEVTKATLAFDEGTEGKPDRVELDLAFAALDLNDLLGTGARGKRTGADMPLTVDQAPDTIIHAKLSAARFDYEAVTATNVVLAGSQTPGRVAVDELSMETFGARIKAHGQVETAGAGGHVTADVAASGADLQTLRRDLGFGALPVTGRLDAQVRVDATAPTLNAATRSARVSAVIGMRGGSIEKQVVEMASTDVRALFRSNKDTTPLNCLLAGLDMRGGQGTVAPLRLRAAEGTISGSAQFDLYRRTIDLTIGSEAKSTGIFALDIPVRVSGSFSSPVVQPAKWSEKGRALLAAADDMSRLPPALREFARRFPCPPTK